MRSKTSLGRYRNSDLISEYWRENGQRCEIGATLPKKARKKVESLRPYPQYRKLELHHIWHRSRHKMDSLSNVIIIDSIIHRSWGHDQNPIELTISSMYVKWRKKRRWCDLYDQEWNPYAGEFNLEELREAAGQCPIAWLDRMRGRYEVGSEWWNLATEIIEFE